MQKKSPWFHYNTRLLKLFNDGKLEYYNPLNISLRGVVNLNKSCKANFLSENKFNLETKERTFFFIVNYLIFIFSLIIHQLRFG